MREPRHDEDGGGGEIDHVVVVVPACNEQDTIGSAVESILVSARLIAPGVLVELVVVANGCCDGTAALARAAGATVIEREIANVGAARRSGCQWALDRSAQTRRSWIATTDADSWVPADWLPAQIEASLFADVFVGTVDLLAVDRARHLAWADDYAGRAAAGGVHGHVHGASLGIRASSYVAAGGFRDLPAHEDVDLVGRLAATGAVLAWDDRVPVVTSARHDSRVVEGVGPDLAASVRVDVLRGACIRAARPELGLF